MCFIVFVFTLEEVSLYLSLLGHNGVLCFFLQFLLTQERKREKFYISSVNKITSSFCLYVSDLQGLNIYRSDNTLLGHDQLSVCTCVCIFVPVNLPRDPHSTITFISTLQGLLLCSQGNVLARHTVIPCRVPVSISTLLLIGSKSLVYMVRFTVSYKIHGTKLTRRGVRIFGLW